MISLPYRWIAVGIALLALLAGAWWKGDQHGQATVQQAWDKEKVAADEQRREDAVMARKASAGYQTQLSQIQGRAAGLQKELRNALTQPITSCPATVGDVVVPAAALDGLRAAGADPAP